MLIRKSKTDNPLLLIKDKCESIFTKRYKIYDDDVIYDAMASIIFQYKKTRQNIKNVDAWVIGAIHYHYVAYIKRKSKDNRFTYDELILNKIEDNDYPHTKIDTDYLFDEINKLNSPQKDVIKMRILEGLAYKEIAIKMNIKASTARKYFERGIINIKKALQIVSLILGLRYVY